MMKLYAGLDVSDRLTHICIADAEGRPSADYGGDYDDSAPISRTDKNPVLQGRNLVQAGRWPLPLPARTTERRKDCGRSHRCAPGPCSPRSGRRKERP